MHTLSTGVFTVRLPRKDNVHVLEHPVWTSSNGLVQPGLLYCPGNLNGPFHLTPEEDLL
jgi:hypothetical protein